MWYEYHQQRQIMAVPPALISITPETVPRTLAKQRAAIAMIPGKIGPKKKPTSALALKLMAMLPGKIATSSPQRLLPITEI
jgi:hypothetical protein